MIRTEAVAKCFIEIACPGLSLRPVEDQSAGQHDFELTYPDGRTGVLEVTCATVERQKHQEARIRTAQRNGFLATTLCQHGWYIVVDLDADIRMLRKKADSYLARIEAEGRTRFSAFTDRHDSDAISRICEELHVIWGETVHWRDGASIVFSGPGSGGKPSPTAVNEAVATEASKPDNLRKLTVAAGRESHIAVVFERLSFEGWAALLGCDPEGLTPILPAEVGYAWAIAPRREPAAYVAWFAANRTPWLHFGPYELTQEMLSAALKE